MYAELSFGITEINYIWKYITLFFNFYNITQYFRFNITPGLQNITLLVACW